MEWGTLAIFCFFLAGLTTGRISNRLRENVLDEFELGSSEEFLAALSESGIVQFSGLGGEYRQALQNIRKNTPNCLQDSLEVELDDGSKRFTIARDSETDLRRFPACVQEDVEIITEYFDKVDKFVMDVLKNKFATKLQISVENKSYELEDLPTKSHLHVYEKDPAAAESANSSLSLPFHTDSGLYLLLTPSSVLPLQLLTRDGSITELPPNDDSIIFLLGTGLTSWLIPEEKLYAVPHAVPSITNSEFLTRTVFGRMKVAPLLATTRSGGETFGEHFYSPLAETEGGTSQHLARLRRQVETDHSQHWPGDKTKN